MSFPLIPPTVERALLLYGCGFAGKNDGQHVLAAGVPEVTVVDIDRGLVEIMAPAYPHGWKFVVADALQYIEEAAKRGRKYDLVVADPWGGHDMADLHKKLPRLKLMARDMLVVGCENAWPVPEDAELIRRSETYGWWVFRP